MKDNNLVSIIVPVYNAEKYLNKCIDSILNQSYKNIEVICINDGSKDTSLEILKQYERQDNRLVIIDKKNNGVSSARNDGIKTSKGEFVTFVDSDDWLEEDAIEQMVKLITKNDCDVIRTNYYLNYAEKEEIRNNNIENKLYNKDEINIQLVEKFLVGKLNCYTVLLLIRKEILNNNVFFNEEVAMLEDKLFYLTLLLNINTIYLSDETYTYHYFQNSNGASLSIKNIERNINNVIDVNNIILGIIDKNIEKKDELSIKSNTHHMRLLMYYFYLLYSENKIKKEKIITKIKQVFSNESIIKKTDVNMLSKDSKIQFKLITSNKFNLLLLYYRIKKFFKRIKINKV